MTLFNLQRKTIQIYGTGPFDLWNRYYVLDGEIKLVYYFCCILTSLNIFKGSKVDGGSAPHPKTRDKSLPVPSGIMDTAGRGCM